MCSKFAFSRSSWSTAYRPRGCRVPRRGREPKFYELMTAHDLSAALPPRIELYRCPSKCLGPSCLNEGREETYLNLRTIAPAGSSHEIAQSQGDPRSRLSVLASLPQSRAHRNGLR